MSETIQTQAQSLSSTAMVELFVLDISEIAPNESKTIWRFANGVNEKREPICWCGNRYTPIPLQVEGLELNGAGTLPRPTLRIANLDSSISAMCLLYQDLVDAKLTVKSTYARFLDANNFIGGNPSANPNQHLPDRSFRVNRKIREDDVFIEFELRLSYDLAGVTLPNRRILTTCPWPYANTEWGGCTWDPVPGKYFDAYDRPTADQDKDLCGKRLTSCQYRFGIKSVLPYGGAPAAGMSRVA